MTPTDNESLTGPMLMLLRRQEKVELMLDALIKAGVIDLKIFNIATLKSTLNHAARIVRIRQQDNRDTTDIDEAVATIKKEVELLESQLSPSTPTP